MKASHGRVGEVTKRVRSAARLQILGSAPRRCSGVDGCMERRDSGDSPRFFGIVFLSRCHGFIVRFRSSR